MFVRLLAGGWDAAKRVNRETEFGITPKLTVLVRLASILHLDRRRDAKETDFKLATKLTLPIYLDRWDRLLDELIQDGLLVPAGSAFTFSHLSFQEFLAAKDLFDPSDKGPIYAVDQYLSGDDWWREVVLFYIALSGKPVEMERFIRDLAKKRLTRTGDISIGERMNVLFQEMMMTFPGSNPDISAI